MAIQLSGLAKRGLLELRPHDDGADRWFVTNFAKRQAPLTPAERQKRSRDNKRKRGGSAHSTIAEIERREAEIAGGVTIRDTDIDIDIEEDIYTDDTHAPSFNRQYERDADQRPEIVELTNELAAVCKEALLPGRNETRYRDVAFWLFANDKTPADVRGFGQWWAEGPDGSYPGPPALTSFENQYKKYDAEQQSNGAAVPTSFVVME